jgi:hypothetical protein
VTAREGQYLLKSWRGTSRWPEAREAVGDAARAGLLIPLGHVDAAATRRLAAHAFAGVSDEDDAAPAGTTDEERAAWRTVLMLTGEVVPDGAYDPARDEALLADGDGSSAARNRDAMVFRRNLAARMLEEARRELDGLMQACRGHGGVDMTDPAGSIARLAWSP